MEQPRSLAPSPSQAMAPQRPSQPPSWNEIADGFDTLGKVGLAMAVGFSAAGLFCRLAQQGKIKTPSLTTLVLDSVTPVTEPRKPKS